MFFNIYVYQIVKDYITECWNINPRKFNLLSLFNDGYIRKDGVRLSNAEVPESQFALPLFNLHYFRFANKWKGNLQIKYYP